MEEEEKKKKRTTTCPLGPKGITPLWTQIAVDCQGQVPWTCSGQRIAMKGTVGKCDKAYRALWTCKGTFGKLWGLKPRV